MHAHSHITRAAAATFSTSEAALLLASTKNHGVWMEPEVVILGVDQKKLALGGRECDSYGQPFRTCQASSACIWHSRRAENGTRQVQPTVPTCCVKLAKPWVGVRVHYLLLLLIY